MYEINNLFNICSCECFFVLLLFKLKLDVRLSESRGCMVMGGLQTSGNCCSQSEIRQQRV